MIEQQRDKLFHLFVKYGSEERKAGRYGGNYNKDKVDIAMNEFIDFLINDIGVTHEETKE